ncbi:MAG: hypothetical protein ACJAZ2_001538 [Glaciecola sp.]|jgi:hypothetical protein
MFVLKNRTMKHIYFFSVTLMLFCNAVLGQLSNGLKAHYNFTTNTVDSSGFGNHGTIVGAPSYTTDRNGNSDCAMQFNGVDSSYISVGFSEDFNVQPDSAFSISLWYKGATVDGGDYEGMFKKNTNQGGGSPLDTDYHLGLHDLNAPSTGSKKGSLFSSRFAQKIFFGDSSWHHVVATYEDAIWTMRIDSSYYEVDTTKTNPIYTSTGSVFLGQSFGGKLDDVRFYNRKLTVNEVGELYRLPCKCHKIVTGIVNVDKSGSIYPNPTDEILNLNNVAIGANYELSDIEGKIVKVGLISSSATLNVSSLSRGVYFLRILKSNKVFRFIKK